MMLDTVLKGIVVLELASYIPGPLCSQILADLGATVIKIERPGGDPLRHLAPRAKDDDSLLFGIYNRGKQLLTLDLKQATDQARLGDLMERADILIDGFRPGTLARLGFDDASIEQLNPRLIRCAISAVGNVPDGGPGTHDLNILAESGLLDLNRVGAQPALPGVQLIDTTSGLMAACAILAALYGRAQGQQGMKIDLAMRNVGYWLSGPWLKIAAAGLPVGQATGLGGSASWYRLYATADGRWLAVAAIEAHFWARFCTAIGRADLIARQHDDDQAALSAEISALIAARPLSEWAAIFAPLDACISPVATAKEAAAWFTSTHNRFGDQLPASAAMTGSSSAKVRPPS